MNTPTPRSMLHKRKRDEYEDSDEEEPTPGRQILPVANLPADFDAEPEDGMQYLFTVRRDARLLPLVTRCANPYEKPRIDEEHLPQASTSHHALPSEEWRTLLITRFKNFKQNSNQPTIHIEQPKDPNVRLMPEKKDRDMWWAFLSGKPESDWTHSRKQKQKEKKGKKPTVDNTILEYVESGPSTRGESEIDSNVGADAVESLPTPLGSPRASVPANLGLIPTPPRLSAREPTPKVLQKIDEPMALHLLMYFTHWINAYVQDPTSPSSTITDSHARWIFSLLSRVGDYVSPDDMNMLRNLTRACNKLLKIVLQRQLQGSLAQVDAPVITESSCWVIISTIIGAWHQRDLWEDVESMLRAVHS